MIATQTFDPVLAPLAAPCRRQADTLLDLRACIASGTRPGRCVACYFELKARASLANDAPFCPLRNWLETHIEILASADHVDASPLESFPLSLGDHDDLETYCRGTLREVYENRAYETDRLCLHFRFRAAPAEAA